MTKLVEMLPIILEKTRSRKLEWERLGNSEYIARLGSVALTTSSQRSETFISLIGETGNILEAISYTETAPPNDSMILQIYELARRSALKIDDSLEALKDALNKL